MPGPGAKTLGTPWQMIWVEEIISAGNVAPVLLRVWVVPCGAGWMLHFAEVAPSSGLVVLSTRSKLTVMVVLALLPIVGILVGSTERVVERTVLEECARKRSTRR